MGLAVEVASLVVVLEIQMVSKVKLRIGDISAD